MIYVRLFQQKKCTKYHSTMSQVNKYNSTMSTSLLKRDDLSPPLLSMYYIISIFQYYSTFFAKFLSNCHISFQITGLSHLILEIISNPISTSMLLPNISIAIWAFRLCLSIFFIQSSIPFNGPSNTLT